MSCDGCRATWTAAEKLRKAPDLDAAFPQCACEVYSLLSDEYLPIASNEMLARVLTTPGGYAADEILTAKLTNATGPGLSLIRSGASDAEILETIKNLVENAAEPQQLIGAAIFAAGCVQKLGDPIRFFGVYHTPDEGKTHHADLLATTPDGSKSQQRKQESLRRGMLKDMMMKAIVFAQQPPKLLEELRKHGL